MRTKLAGVFFAAVTAMILGGCSRVQEPWDSTGYFKEERARSAAQEKALRERALHGEVDREPGIQQVNRT